MQSVKRNPNSLLHWLPAVQEARVPTPRTECVEVGLTNFARWQYNEAPLPKPERFTQAAERIGYPLFLRTDLASAKHHWLDSCYVEGPDNLMRHIWEVVEFNFMVNIVGLPCEALVFREYVPLESSFRAFKGMPVARERRYFVRDGAVECHHPYWIEDAIAKHGVHEPMLPPDWKAKLRRLNTQTVAEVEHLTPLAQRVGELLRGAWSVDFARTAAGEWLLIDMAIAEESYHEEHP
jgi:hypothetical protein